MLIKTSAETHGGMRSLLNKLMKKVEGSKTSAGKGWENLGDANKWRVVRGIVIGWYADLLSHIAPRVKAYHERSGNVISLAASARSIRGFFLFGDGWRKTTEMKFKLLWGILWWQGENTPDVIKNVVFRVLLLDYFKSLVILFDFASYKPLCFILLFYCLTLRCVGSVRCGGEWTQALWV